MDRLLDIKQARDDAAETLKRNADEREVKLTKIRDKTSLIISLFFQKGTLFDYDEVCECGGIDSIYIEEIEYCLQCMNERNVQ